jgi:hypothetical protein
MPISLENALSVPYRIFGAKKQTVYNVTCSEKYVEKGEVLTAAQLGLNVVDTATPILKAIGAGTVNIANAFYEPSTSKLILYDETPAEIANEAEIKKPVFQITATGN